jgi:hypothetical protein
MSGGEPGSPSDGRRPPTANVDVDSAHFSPQSCTVGAFEQLWVHNGATPVATPDQVAPMNYGYIDFDALLFQKNYLSAISSSWSYGDAPSRHNRSKLLKTLLDTHPNINTPIYYPERAVQLPELPDTLHHLYT